MGFDRVSQDSRRTENKKARNHAGFVLDITDCRAMPKAGLLPLNYKPTKKTIKNQYLNR